MYSRQFLFSISVIAIFIFSAQTAYSQTINLEQLGSLTKAMEERCHQMSLMQMYLSKSKQLQ